MSDLSKYVSKRRTNDFEFNKDFDEGYEAFKIGAMLKQAREASGLTQEEIANSIKHEKVGYIPY